MRKTDFYKQLIKLKFTRITTCEGEKTDYFYIDLPRIRIIFNKWNNKEYGLYVRDVEDNNMCDNLVLKTFKKLDEQKIKFIKKFIDFLKGVK